MLGRGLGGGGGGVGKAAVTPAGGATGGYLVVSSQGDNAYTLYRLADMTYAGRFRIGAKGTDSAIDGTSETDGIELALGDFGPDYPEGLFVAHHEPEHQAIAKQPEPAEHPADRDAAEGRQHLLQEGAVSVVLHGSPVGCLKAGVIASGTHSHPRPHPEVFVDLRSTDLEGPGGH